MTSNEPYSEQLRMKGLEWVEADAAARLLEEGKSAYLAQRMNALGDIPVSKAEKEVKGSADWSDYIKKLASTRTRANRLKVELEYIKMKHWEDQNANATRRAEMRM